MNKDSLYSHLKDWAQDPKDGPSSLQNAWDVSSFSTQTLIDTLVLAGTDFTHAKSEYIKLQKKPNRTEPENTEMSALQTQLVRLGNIARMITPTMKQAMINLSNTDIGIIDEPEFELASGVIDQPEPTKHALAFLKKAEQVKLVDKTTAHRA